MWNLGKPSGECDLPIPYFETCEVELLRPRRAIGAGALTFGHFEGLSQH
jgi:hypothetical protein